MRRAARKDRNHNEVAIAFEKLGCEVLDLSQIGGGCPDLLVCKGNRYSLVEVKDGALPASRRKLTPDEERFWDNWRGNYAVVGTLDEVKALFILELSPKVSQEV